VQVYPAVEYDFVPTELTVERGTWVHFQWTGSDANQANQAGNGLDKTDRSNLVQIKSRQENVPIGADKHTLLTTDGMGSGKEILKKFSYLGQHNKVACDPKSNNDNDQKNCKQLNGASAYFDGDLVQMNQMGVHHVMSTRNNDFSNRSQKATISVIFPSWRVWQVEILIVLGVLVVGGLVYLGAAFYALRRPQSWLFASKNRPRILRYMASPETIERKENERRAYIEDERRMLLGSGGSSQDESRGPAPSSLDVYEATGDFSVPWEKYGRPGKERCLRLFACCGLGEGQQLFVVAYLLLNGALFVAGFGTHLLGETSYAVAKGGGYMLDLNLAMVILPTLKSLQTSLHGKGGLAREWIPLDDPIKFHRTIAWMVCGATFIHIFGHVWSLVEISSSAKLQEDTLNVYGYSERESAAGTPIAEQLLSVKMTTGILLTILFFLLFMTAHAWCRRRGGSGFSAFQRVHAWWPWIYLVLLIHGNQRTWVWLFFPAIYVLVDRLSQLRGQQFPGVLLSARLLPKDVIHLTFEPPEGFTYEAGQYILLFWNGEWHPFTLTSAPEENVITVHIRSASSLDWCHALRRTLITEGPARAKGDQDVGAKTPEPEPGTIVKYERVELPGGITCCRPQGASASRAAYKKSVTTSLDQSLHDRLEAAGAVLLKISGPFGAPAQRVWEFGPIVVVGAGIGVTPFVSIMRSAQLRAQQRASMLGAAKVNVNIVKEKNFRKNWEENKRMARQQTAAVESESRATIPAPAATSWLSLAKLRKRGKKKAAASSVPEEDYESSRPSSSGAAPGEDWNPEMLAELVQDVIPLPTKIHFYWIVRSQVELDWFYDLLAAAVEGSASDIAEVNFFTTQDVGTEDLKALPCKSKHHFGRPNWPSIFKAVKEEHPGEHVGVFLCGNPAIGEELATQSRQQSDPPDNREGTRFSFFKEHF